MHTSLECLAESSLKSWQETSNVSDSAISEINTKDRTTIVRTLVGERGRGNSERRRASQEAKSVITKHLNFILAENGISHIAYPVSPFQPRNSSPLSPAPSLIRVHLDSLLPPLAKS